MRARGVLSPPKLGKYEVNGATVEFCSIEMHRTTIFYAYLNACDRYTLYWQHWQF